MQVKRYTSIDSVKGFCLLHMLLLHLSIINGEISYNGDGSGIYFHLMEFFMIPFFLFSGYFFSAKKDYKEFIAYKAKKLLIPFVFWSAVSLPVYYISRYLITGEINLLGPFPQFIRIGSLASNGPLWFLFSLFSVNIIFYIVLRNIKNERLILLFVILCFIYALVDRYYLPCFFSSSNISLGLVYFYIGYKLRGQQENVNVLSFRNFVIAVFVFVLISVFNPQWMQLVELSQSEGYFLLNMPHALSGTYILWYLFSKVPSMSIFSYFGRNSMVYYVWHMILLRFIYDPICKMECSQMSYYQYVIVGGGIILVTSWLLDRYLSKYCPSLIGK